MHTLARCLAPLLLALTLALPACSQNVPPNLSPAGVTAYQATRVIVALDAVRDIAVDAEKTTPPLIPHATMLKVVAWHKVAITTAHDAPAGWTTSIQTSLNGVQSTLTPSEHTQLDPYFTLASTLLKEVAK